MLVKIVSVYITQGINYRRRSVSEWIDRKGRDIKTGDILSNPFNEPPRIEVLTDGKSLYLGDMETPFNKRYQFENFWEVV